MTRPILPITLIVAAGLVAGTPARGAQAPGGTQALAAEFTTLMQQKKLDAAAAQLTDNTFVAALYYPGTELLVVSAEYTAPALLVQKLNAGNFRDIYMDLASASVPSSKILIEDMKADGIRPDRDGDNPFDIVTRGTDAPVNFDGDAGKAKLSDDAYRALFQETEATYTRDLRAMIEQLKKLP